ncbi:G-type lectin S-receptor-like serine/threonine-protein kinase CES101 isoform X2 [Pistacia vera]|uniref:G-type lectin S-receptor-like serine/threonine-protein kinase CES101 isoform X2 n=1 Tax=Pistacia vera TaxID=55513 RepID=UPI0012635316|nr:G-type lectin S-receptor-like serine/threonine-protein kinase CES101 isoform X2 [Pistacia vera]
MASKERIFPVLLSFSLFILFLRPSYSKTINKLQQGQQLKDGDELVSASGKFRLGFFSPLMSTNRYIGIWHFSPTGKDDFYYHKADGYYQNSKPVWVANRSTPISDKSGKLVVDSTDGNLKFSSNSRNPIAISTVQGVNNTSAILLESGNLILHERNSDGSIRRVLWQSFDYPTDTLLPGMKLGFNLQTRNEWFLQSWTDIDSPAPGPFTLRMDPNVTNRLISCRRSEEVYWTSEPWLNNHFNFSRSWALNNYYNFSYTSNEQENFFIHSASGDALQILRINADGGLTNGGGLFVSCTKYGGCWKEKQQEEICWTGNRSIENWHFRRGYMLGDGFNFSKNMNFLDCQDKCIKNCSCAAFAPAARNFTGCQIWSRGTKFRHYLSHNSRFISMLDFHDHEGTAKKMKKPPWLIIEILGSLAALLLIILGALSYKVRRKDKGIEERRRMSFIFALGVALVLPFLCYLCYLMAKKLKTKVQSVNNRKKLLQELASTLSHAPNFGRRKRKRKKGIGHDLKIFDFQTIEVATNNFSTENKVGEGGFGPVYKGKLVDGQEIAVKRLSRVSAQGIKEFKNEVKLIAKLQHTNLVKLLGCSLYEEERILVYEHMSNKSLDFFIFDSDRTKLLNWKKRFSIIEGIAQGLLYLHKYSRLQVIHRDLKANNILLDNEMNPKISDFGMARIFKVNEPESNTNKIVGTHKKNNGIYHPERPLNLVGYAWQLWNDGKALELIDSEILDGPSSPGEVLRCIHVGLLCAQDQAADRPKMSKVVSMLTPAARPFPAPKQPAFFINVRSAEPEASQNKSKTCSVNEVTISIMEPR